MREEEDAYRNERLREDRAKETGEMMKMYADRVKKKAPAEHALAVVKATNPACIALMFHNAWNRRG